MLNIPCPFKGYLVVKIFVNFNQLKGNNSSIARAILTKLHVHQRNM